MTKSNAGRSRILVVSPTYPFPLVSGGKQRIYHILRQLSRHFSITLLTLAEDHGEEETYRAALPFIDEVVAVPIQQSRVHQVLRLLWNLPQWLLGTPAEVLVKASPKMMSLFRQLIDSGHFDVVQLEYAQSTPYLRISKLYGVPTILVAHDISFISQERKAALQRGLMRFFWGREATLMKRLEIDAWHRADLVIAMSDHDCAQIQKLAPSGAVVVVPNGVDIESLSPTVEGRQPRIIFTGWMRHLPNLDAVEWFIKDVWPLIRQNHPSVRFSIVGKGFPHALLSLARRDERIDYLGFVEDITSVVGKAWVPVVPLRIGSGTRLKLLKPMALGTPVATNTIAYEGVDATPELHLLLGDSSQDLAGVTLKLLRDHELRRQVANAARKLVKCKYSWLAVGKAAVASVHGTAAKEQKME